VTLKRIKFLLPNESKVKKNISSFENGLKFALEDIYSKRKIDLKEHAIQYVLDNGYIKYDYKYP